jgi:predicted aspartyl protease
LRITRTYATVLLIWLLAAIVAFGQAATQLSPQARIDRAIAAHGGPAALKQANEHLMEESDIDVLKPVRNHMHAVSYHSGDRVLMIFQVGAIEGKMYVDKKAGWLQLLGGVNDITGDQLAQEQQEMEHDITLLLQAKETGYTRTDLGRKKLPDGLLTDGVRVQPPKGAPTDFYFEPDTGLVAGIGYRGRNYLRGVDVDFLQRLSDYRTQDGMPVNFAVRAYEDGELSQSIKVAKMDLKSEIPESIFARPGAAAANTTSATVPFEFSTGEIVVSASINGKAPRRFIVDTGAAISILMPSVVRELGLKVNGEANLGAGGGAAAAKFASADSIRIGSATIKDVNVAVLDLGSLGQVMGGKFGGLLGYNVLSQFQITIDYAAHQITFAPPLSPLPTGKAVRMDLAGAVPIIDVQAGGQKFRMVLDTGATGTILPARVGARLLSDKVFDKVDDGLVALGADGSPIRLKAGRLPSLTIGEQTARGVLVSFAPVSAKSTGALLNDFANGLLGNTFLRRYRVTLDYAKKQVVLVPQAAGDPYPDEWTHPGLDVVAIPPNGRPKIAKLYPNSPAAKAGLQLGDVVQAIDQKPTNGMTNFAVAIALHGPENSTVRLTVLHNGKPKTYTLKRVRLL